MRVDLHVHTSDWSDGKGSAEEMIEAAIANGIDGIAIADHARMLAPEDQAALNAKYPEFRVFRAAEVSVPGRDHFLLVGGAYQPLPELPQGEKRSVDDVIRYAEQTGCLTVFNHPFWLDPTFKVDFDRFAAEAMDILSLNVDTRRLNEYARVAVDRRMLLLAASDAHDPAQVGIFHIDLDVRCDTDEELVAEIRAGHYSLGTCPDLWARRVEEVAGAEALAIRCLSEGLSDEESLAAGCHAGFLRRVRNGGSHMPVEELLGLRGDGWDALVDVCGRRRGRVRERRSSS